MATNKHETEIKAPPAVGLSFSLALEYLKAERRMARAGWNGKGMWIELVKRWRLDVDVTEPDYAQLELLPFIVMKTADNKLVPWLASQTDQLATDWEIVVQL